MELAKQFDPKSVEERWFQRWVDAGYFRAAPELGGEAFSMVIPPPNVTGQLHLGHALNVTLQDIIVRTRRMQGFNTLWLPGTDHAGIATQNVVERELAKQGTTRHELGREAFVARVWQWRETYGRRILHQLRRLGASCDWSRERFTLDPALSRAVVEVFVRLYEEGLIYHVPEIDIAFERQLLSFPAKGCHDDYVDALVWALSGLDGVYGTPAQSFHRAVARRSARRMEHLAEHGVKKLTFIDQA